MKGRGRNTKAPKKANHGAKPCSSVMIKLKKKDGIINLKENELILLIYGYFIIPYSILFF